MENEELKKIIEKNNSMIEEILIISKQIKKYMIISQVMFWVKFLIILAPIIFALIYLPPFLKDVVDTYGELLKR